jgi:hypothetical protein
MTGIKALLVPAFALGCVLAPCGAVAQQASDTARPSYDGSDSPNAPKRIYIDQDCRIEPDPAHPLPGKKLRPFSDSNICHLESVAQSNHIEERIAGDELYRSRIYIAEQEYVLQNITDGQVMFIVQHAVSPDWTVDSDPLPLSTEGNIAVFPVYADPGQIVRLHVGLRHTQPLKTKFIGAKSSAPQGTTGN